MHKTSNKSNKSVSWHNWVFEFIKLLHCNQTFYFQSAIDLPQWFSIKKKFSIFFLLSPYFLIKVEKLLFWNFIEKKEIFNANWKFFLRNYLKVRNKMGKDNVKNLYFWIENLKIWPDNEFNDWEKIKVEMGSLVRGCS